jgi:serine/threonine protein kinase
MSFEDGFIFKTHDLKINTQIKESNLNVDADFEIVRKLGDGTFGTVYEVKHVRSDKRL